MVTTTPQETMRQVQQMLEQGDWAALEAHPGLYETRQYFPAMLHAFPDLRHTVEKEMVSDDMIAMVVTCEGTHREAFLGIPATGRQVRFMLLSIDRVVDGLVVEHWALPDWLSLLHQLSATIQPATQ